MKPLFAPGTNKKAHYSDANFQLLGKVIESITQLSYAENCERVIFNPLQLQSTYVYVDATDATPKPLHYKANQLHIPKAMTAWSRRGIVSTNADMLQFIQAFFTGKLFPERDLAELQQWNKIFFPMESGVGLHRFKLPWIFNPTGAVPLFIGHSGLSGALAFYSPKENLWVVGTVNQVAHPDISFRTMVKLAQVALKK